MNQLKAVGLNPKFHQLDITDETSINALRDHIKDTYGGIDILINNAAIMLDVSDYDYTGLTPNVSFTNNITNKKNSLIDFIAFRRTSRTRCESKLFWDAKSVRNSFSFIEAERSCGERVKFSRTFAETSLKRLTKQI